MFTVHSKTISVFVICLALVFSALFIKNKQRPKPTISEPIVDSRTVKIETDSDLDGLKDWEEDILGTDKNNKDSDNDGTMDGQEVKDGRDPKIKGPNDSVKSTVVYEKTEEKNNERKTLTSSIAKNFFANYLYAKKESGGSLDTQAITSIANETFSGSNLTLNPKVYDIKDIVVSNTASKETYRKNLESLVYANTPKKMENELSIMQEALKQNDKKTLEKLNPIISSYENIINGILKIPVPQDAVGLHLTLLNTVSSIYTNIKAMKEVFADPVYGYLSLSQQNIDVVKLSTILKKYSKYFGDVK